MMATFTEKLLYLDETKELIGQQVKRLVGEGAVTETTPFRDYAELLSTIQLGATGESLDYETNLSGIHEIAAHLQMTEGSISTFASTTGEVFVHCGAATIYNSNGIWRLNKITKAFEKVYTGSGYGFSSWYESKNGEIFVSSTNSATAGLLYWDKANNIFKSVLSVGYSWNIWSESSTGTICVSSDSFATAGIYRWTGTTFTQGHTALYGWKGYPDKSGNLLFVSNQNSTASTSHAIVRLTGTTFSSVLTQGTTAGVNQYICTNDAGDIFFTGNYVDAGIRRWPNNGSALAALKSNGQGFTYFLQFGNNVLFSSSANATNCYGIFGFNGSSFYTCYSSTTEYSFNPFFLASDGRFFVSSSSASFPGIWSGTTVATDSIKKVHTTGYGWSQWKQGINTVLVSSTAVAHPGFMVWNGTNFATMIGTGYYYNVAINLHDGGTLMTGSSQSYVNGAFVYKNGLASKVTSDGYNFNQSLITDVGTFVWSSNQYAIGIYLWNGTEFKRVYNSGYDWVHMKMSPEGEITASSNFDFGFIRYNRYDGKFELINEKYVGRKFGKYTMSIGLYPTQRVYNGQTEYKTVNDIYNTDVTGGKVGFAVIRNGSATKYLYIEGV